MCIYLRNYKNPEFLHTLLDTYAEQFLQFSSNSEMAELESFRKIWTDKEWSSLECEEYFYFLLE